LDWQSKGNDRTIGLLPRLEKPRTLDKARHHAMRGILFACLGLVLAFSPAWAEDPPGKPGSVTIPNPLPVTQLAPARLMPDLCLYRYKISTDSPECQAFFDQGLGFFYSYVWMEAARSFETALQHDPNCPMAYWGLSRALERWGRGDANKELTKAYDLRYRATYAEQQLILARMQEKGLIPGVGDGEARRQAAINTLDALLAVHDDDQEAWFARGLVAANNQLFGGTTASLPFYKALVRINPLHPGATHELVHFYENFQRPALGWPYSEAYIQSSPGIPHSWHMQSHLAMRLGRWDRSSASSTRAIELQRQYHREMNVKPADDHQFSHHLETLFLSLLHDGKFRDCRTLKEECLGYGFKHPVPWFRLHMAERNFAEALKIAEEQRKADKLTGSYLSALVFLALDDLDNATAEIEVLAEAFRSGKKDKVLKHRLWEAQGQLLCRLGSPEAGLKLLQKCVEETKDDYTHHAWGNGAYYMEVWGLAALRAGKLDVAEEAFLEALAHESGCVRAAMGMQVLCELQGREEEARHFAGLARRFWKHAEVQDFDRELTAIRQSALRSSPTTSSLSESRSEGTNR
jgi:tetratricopeptide (TPR) repeat protein